MTLLEFAAHRVDNSKASQLEIRADYLWSSFVATQPFAQESYA